MSRKVAVAFVLALVVTVAGVGPAAAQSETVTLTVSVVDRAGDPVGNARLTAEWDGGSRSATTASNGKAFVDVPAGADVALSISHPDYVRNYPLSVEDATERDVRMEVARKGSATVRVTDADGVVTGATVTMRKDLHDVASGTTDASGEFHSGTIEQGNTPSRCRRTGTTRSRNPCSSTAT
ncbi:MAG: hypothetical protein ABEJ82_03900 [Haloplanus sp.]